MELIVASLVGLLLGIVTSLRGHLRSRSKASQHGGKESCGKESAWSGYKSGNNSIVSQIQYSAKFDGKDYPATGIVNADAVSVKRIDANTVETMQKKDGKVVMTITTWHGKNAEGKDVHNVVVFDKK